MAECGPLDKIDSVEWFLLTVYKLFSYSEFIGDYVKISQ